MQTPEQISIRNAKEALPRYQSHKVVRAARIHAIDRQGWGGFLHLIVPEEERFRVIQVTTDYMLKHQPHAGGYYVYYDDGYESFSPPEAFESGYTRRLETDAVEKPGVQGVDY